MAWPPRGLGMYLSGALYLSVGKIGSNWDPADITELGSRISEYVKPGVLEGGQFLGETDDDGNWLFGIYQKSVPLRARVDNLERIFH